MKSDKGMSGKSRVKFYLIGGGIASLASAVYLIRDGHVSGEDIVIFEESKLLGGSLDAAELPSEMGYTMRGFRMLEEKVYSCTYDLFSHIPSVSDPKKTLRDELFVFNKRVKAHTNARLIKNGQVISARMLGLKFKDRIALLVLLVRPESSMEGMSIDEYFTSDFFKSNFYFEFGTTFSFQPWSSLVEFKRYIFRFLQDVPILDTLDSIRSTKYNQYESIVVPIVEWLKTHGVAFVMETRVVDLDFLPAKDKKTVTSIQYIQKGERGRISLNDNDLVFATLGSMTADSSLGSMTSAPKSMNLPSTAWDLWKNISRRYSDLGNPATYYNNTEKTEWVSFTMTHKSPVFFQLMEELTRKKAGEGGHITFTDSNWLISIGLPNQPHFIDQPKNINVSWGYGLFPNKKGNYVKKKMTECTGKEIMTELLNHLKFSEHMQEIINTSICIPILMPYITSQILPRTVHDRPLVVPQGSTNLALIGQYSEIPEDIVFTIEYSVRSAQMAVYELLNIDKNVTPIYRGQRKIKVVLNAVITAFR